MSGVLDRQILFRTIPSCAISRLRRPATEDVSSPLKPKPVRVRLSYQLPPPPHAHTRTRMHTLARMFARFCFNVSLFALLVLLTHVVVRGAASVLYTPPCRKRAKPTNGGQCSQRRRTQIKQPALGPTRCRPARCPLLARLLPMPIGVRGSKKRAARARARESTRTQLHHNASHTAQPHRQRDLTRT